MRYLFLLLFLFSVSANAQPAGSGGEPTLILPIGHTSDINSLHFSPNGKRIVTSASDYSIKVWDYETGALIVNIKGDNPVIHAADYSPDGKNILSTALYDNTASIWNAETGKLVRELKCSQFISQAEYSPDGKKVVTCTSYDANIWDARSGNSLIELGGSSSHIKAAHFSPDGKKIITTSFDSTAKIWEVESGKLLFTIPKEFDKMRAAYFSPNGQLIITLPNGRSAKIWNSDNGKLMYDLNAPGEQVISSKFSPDGKSVLVFSFEEHVSVWNLTTGSIRYDLSKICGNVSAASFSPDNKKILVKPKELDKLLILDALTGNVINEIKAEPNSISINPHPQFSPDSKKILTSNYFGGIRAWDAVSGQLEKNIKGHSDKANYIRFSPDDSKMAAFYENGMVKLWDLKKGEIIQSFQQPNREIRSGEFSPDGETLLTVADSVVLLWNAVTGKLIRTLEGHQVMIFEAHFSPDGKKIVTAGNDSLAKVWDPLTGTCLFNLKGHQIHQLSSVSFSPDGKKIASTARDSLAIVWNAETGEKISEIKAISEEVFSAAFSSTGNLLIVESSGYFGRYGYLVVGQNDITGQYSEVLSEDEKSEFTYAKLSSDGKLLITTSYGGVTHFRDPANLKIIEEWDGKFKSAVNAQFSPDRKKLYSKSERNVYIYDIIDTGRFILEGHSDYLRDVQFSHDNRIIATASDDNTCKLWEASTRRLLYTFILVDSTDYIVMDEYNRFDGTESARKLLYYTCGSDIINLNQFKDLSWESGLAGKIMNGNRESIGAKKLSEINICNATPVIEEKGLNKKIYHFEIMPRSKGVGEIQVYVNNKLVKTYPPTAVPRKNNKYVLSFSEKEVLPYFIPGMENEVIVKATTADGSMISRGGTVRVEGGKKTKEQPNVYIISIGISQYKSNELRLYYAAKDAKEFSSALTLSARKLLNTDGAEHVFSFNFNTDGENKQWPFKRNITGTLDSISRKARAEDVFVFFFAGHGTLKSDKKNLFLLTAEASAFELAGVEKEVSLSFNELKGWMQKIKANKQLLVLDACHSGLVVEMLDALSRKRSIPTDQVWALEDMKDKTGTYILTASTSEQSGFETSLYNQGILTYCLLSGIKLGESLTDNKYIDVSKWFNTTVNTVKNMARELGKTQEPKFLGNAGFTIGLVDKQVTDSIKLSLKKKVFRRSNFVIDGAVPSDNLLEMSSQVDKALNQVSARGKESPFTYIPDNNFMDPYTIVGRYWVMGNGLKLKCFLLKGKDERPLYEFEMNGLVDKKEELALGIVEEIKKYIEQH